MEIVEHSNFDSPLRKHFCYTEMVSRNVLRGEYTTTQRRSQLGSPHVVGTDERPSRSEEHRREMNAVIVIY